MPTRRLISKSLPFRTARRSPATATTCTPGCSITPRPASAIASPSTTAPARSTSSVRTRSACPRGRCTARCGWGTTARSPPAAGRVVPSAKVVGPRRRGRRIVYCTDTRPCRATIELARGADILIHESTYGDDMQAEAGERGHSTAADAARVAAEAGVRRLILTHISPRYTDAAPLLAEARAIFAETELAADFAEIRA